MSILGHSQISVTMNTYSHVLPEMHQDAANLMDVFLRGFDGEPKPDAGVDVSVAVIPAPRQG
jgi:hypothetical protein